LAQKLEVCNMFINRDFFVKTVLEKVGVANSTWYDQDKNRAKNNVKIRGRKIPGYSLDETGVIYLDAKIVNILKSYRTNLLFDNAGGYYKLAKYIRREYGIIINPKKVYRLCTENKLLLPLKKKKKRRGRKICRNRVINEPNKLWEFDIKYGFIHGENRFFYVLGFIDVFTRKVVGLHIGLSCKSEDLCFVLSDALTREGISDEDSLVIRSDNGTQMTSKKFYEKLSKLDIIIEHEFIPLATPNKNAHIESFFSILETELFQVRYFSNFKESYDKTVEFVEFYNERRIHGSLNYHPPLEACSRFADGVREIEEVRV